MGLKATFQHFHGEEYEDVYVRLTRPMGEKTNWVAQFDVYTSEDAYNKGEHSLETLSVEFKYDYTSNLYKLAYTALKEQYPEKLTNTEDIL